MMVRKHLCCWALLIAGIVVAGGGMALACMPEGSPIMLISGLVDVTQELPGGG